MLFQRALGLRRHVRVEEVVFSVRHIAFAFLGESGLLASRFAIAIAASMASLLACNFSSLLGIARADFLAAWRARAAAIRASSLSISSDSDESKLKLGLSARFDSSSAFFSAFLAACFWADVSLVEVGCTVLRVFFAAILMSLQLFSSFYGAQLARPIVLIG